MSTMISTSYTDARERLAELLDNAVNDCEVVEIRRRGRESVAMIAMSELRSLLETVYLLQSPTNAERVLKSLERAQNRTGQIVDLRDLENRLDSTRQVLKERKGQAKATTTTTAGPRKKVGEKSRTTAGR